jgi:hypothetical protein
MEPAEGCRMQDLSVEDYPGMHRYAPPRGLPPLLEMLADRTIADDASVPHTGLPAEWERRLSAPFVLHETYGTRCSTVVLADNHDRCTVFERRFDSTGHETGRTRIRFDQLPVSEGFPDAAGNQPVTSGESPGESSPE